MTKKLWKCKICDKEIETSIHGKPDLENHLRQHKEYLIYTSAEEKYYEEERAIDKKYCARYLGGWFSDVTPPKKSRLWISIPSRNRK